MTTTTTTTAAAGDNDNTNNISAPEPQQPQQPQPQQYKLEAVTAAARRLQARLWAAATYGRAAAADDKAWVAALFAEHGDLLASRAPIFEWPHYGAPGAAASADMHLTPLMWLLCLLNDDASSSIAACLAVLVRERGLSLDDEYAHTFLHVMLGMGPHERVRPLAFAMRYLGTWQGVSAMRTLLALAADPNLVDASLGRRHSSTQSPLYVALASGTMTRGLDAAQLLLDHGARLDPALDGGVILHALKQVPGRVHLERLVPLLVLARQRGALSGLENASARNGYHHGWGALHWLVHEAVKMPFCDVTRLDRVTAMIRELHLNVGVSTLTPGKAENEYVDNDISMIRATPLRTVLQYMNDALLEWEPYDGQHARLQHLIDFVAPLERAERRALRPLAVAAELSLKRSRLFGGLTLELRRLVLAHVLAWSVQV